MTEPDWESTSSVTWGCKSKNLTDENRDRLLDDFGIRLDENGDIASAPEGFAFYLIVNASGKTIIRMNCPVEAFINAIREIADGVEIECIENGGRLDPDRFDS